MSALSLISSLCQYKAWANEALFAKLEAIDPVRHEEERHKLIQVLNHVYVVDRIFAAHLTGTVHAYTGTNTPDTPTLGTLRKAVKDSDKWYVGYSAQLSTAELEQVIEFTCPDGKPGCMRREEMLTHVVTHGGNHRGTVGRMLSQLSIQPPAEVFAGFLHQTQPERRVHAGF